MAFRRQVLTVLVLSAAPFLLPACREAKVAYYIVPKEKDPELPGAGSDNGPNAGPGGAPMAPGASLASTAVPTAAGPELTWVAPAQWTAKPGSAMRKGSYAVPGPDGAMADLSITAFPGDVGGALANVNRWRGQVGLPPLGEADLAGASEAFDHNGLQFTVVDLGSEQSSRRLLGAIVPFGEGTWFFKLLGPAPVVAEQKAAFLDFLKTVKPAAGS
jgi:hypothetical protein